MAHRKSFWVGFNSPRAAFWSVSNLGVPHAHDGSLQLALDGGAIGRGLLVIGMLSTASRLLWLLRHEREPLIVWSFAFMGFYVVYNLVETWLWAPNEVLTVYFVYVVVHSSITERQ
jgi:hypothetical protein